MIDGIDNARGVATYTPADEHDWEALGPSLHASTDDRDDTCVLDGSKPTDLVWEIDIVDAPKKVASVVTDSRAPIRVASKVK